MNKVVSLGGLGVPCSPRDPRFAGSNPAEVDGFFSGRKNPEISGSLKNLKPEKIGLLAKINRHIYVLVSKFGEHNRSQKGHSALGQQ